MISLAPSTNGTPAKVKEPLGAALSVPETTCPLRVTLSATLLSAVPETVTEAAAVTLLSAGWLITGAGGGADRVTMLMVLPDSLPAWSRARNSIRWMPLPSGRGSHSVVKEAEETRATCTSLTNRSIHFTPSGAVAVPVRVMGRETVWPSVRLNAVMTGPPVM